MTFDNSNYSAFDISAIVSKLRRRNVVISFEKIEQLYKAFDDIFPLLLEAKVESKKFFDPAVQIKYYDCDSCEMVKLVHYNPYSDAGLLFSETDKINMQNTIDFLNSFSSLSNLYFVDAPNLFGTYFTPYLENILEAEYNLNHIDMNAFNENDLKQFVSYLPKLYEFCEDVSHVKFYGMGMTSVVVTPDHKPKKFNFSIPKDNLIKLIGETTPEVKKIIQSSSIDYMVKVGFYFNNLHQNNWSIQFNNIKEIIDDIKLPKKLKEQIVNEKDCSFGYEMVWSDQSIKERNILFCKAEGGLTDP